MGARAYKLKSQGWSDLQVRPGDWLWSGLLYSRTTYEPTVQLFLLKAMAKLRRTACFQNLHYFILNPNVHYLSKQPIARALFSSRIPAFLEFMRNLKLGPSASKGKKFIYCYTVSFLFYDYLQLKGYPRSIV